MYESDCNDHIMGALLVLLQLDYPRETETIEHIFSKIAAQRSFNFPYFVNYLVTADFIEELLYLWNTITDMKYVLHKNNNNHQNNNNGTTSAATVPSTTTEITSAPTSSAPMTTTVATSTRRTRNSHHDKNVTTSREDDPYPLFKQQTLRCNENIFTLISTFIVKEQTLLMSLLFDTKSIKKDLDT